jgi:hypothetical protein
MRSSWVVRKSVVDGRHHDARTAVIVPDVFDPQIQLADGGAGWIWFFAKNSDWSQAQGWSADASVAGAFCTS